MLGKGKGNSVQLNTEKLMNALNDAVKFCENKINSIERTDRGIEKMVVVNKTTYAKEMLPPSSFYTIRNFKDKYIIINGRLPFLKSSVWLKDILDVESVEYMKFVNKFKDLSYLNKLKVINIEPKLQLPDTTKVILIYTVEVLCRLNYVPLPRWVEEIDIVLEDYNPEDLAKEVCDERALKRGLYYTEDMIQKIIEADPWTDEYTSAEEDAKDVEGGVSGRSMSVKEDMLSKIVDASLREGV